MSPYLSAAERIKKARALIEQAYALPAPEPFGRADLSYIAQVKDLLRQARDLVKFIPNQPSATPELKQAVQAVFAEADRANQELLHSGR